MKLETIERIINRLTPSQFKNLMNRPPWSRDRIIKRLVGRESMKAKQARLTVSLKNEREREEIKRAVEKTNRNAVNGANVNESSFCRDAILLQARQVNKKKIIGRPGAVKLPACLASPLK